jgi:hypothetical protein
MEACPLTARDLLHLDYAICLGYAESLGADPLALAAFPVLEWPGPAGHSGLFIAADAILSPGGDIIPEDLDDFDFDEDELDLDDDDNDGGENEGGPPFDL